MGSAACSELLTLQFMLGVGKMMLYVLNMTQRARRCRFGSSGLPS